MSSVYKPFVCSFCFEYDIVFKVLLLTKIWQFKEGFEDNILKIFFKLF